MNETMDSVDPKLMQQIVEQVMAALKGKGLAAPAAAPASAKGKSAAPKADKPQARKSYVSQFAPAWQRKAGETAKAPAAPQKIFLTADMLQRRIAAASAKGTVELAANEVLTPAARDLADDKHITIRRAASNLQTAPAPAAAAKPSPKPGDCKPGVCTAPAPVAQASPQGTGMGVVVLKPDAKVQSLLSAIGHDNVATTDFSQTNCWVCNLTNLCNAIACGQTSMGVAILPYAADAMMLANKFKGIRAVQGTRAESVAGAIRHFGANLLILEHTASTFHEMRQMVRTLVTEPRIAPPPGRLTDALNELEK